MSDELPAVLVVDDEFNSRSALEMLVRREGADVVSVSTLVEAESACASRRFAAILVDYYLPDGAGLELVERLGESRPEIVLVTGRSSVEIAVEALRAGVADFLEKPVDPVRLKAVLEAILRTGRFREEIRSLRGELRELGRFGSMIGGSPAMQRVYDLVARVAPSEATILVRGESGTGKELVADTIHRLSRRAHRPFVAINCGAISSQLIESELFGHERGSFTGAEKQRRGVFERAHTGTLFLDEISEMPLELQVKLLRVLESRNLTRVGGEKGIDVDVRIVAATNRDLEGEVRDGRFREDLLYRLRVVDIELPPLRERGDDLEALAGHFLAEFARQRGIEQELSREALAALGRHGWPGNVRELRNVMQQASILAEDVVAPEHLPAPLRGEAKAAGPAFRESTGQADSPATVVLELPLPLAEVERRVALATLALLGGDKAATAERLGISLKTLYSRLREYAARPDA